ncbi:MAG TPA: threonine synthase [Longimicrobiales bacterium]
MRGLLDRYRTDLPVTDTTPRLTLGEGGTPLLEVPRLAAWVGVEELYLKFEGANPTGSFKDRGMVLAVAKAVEQGARAMLCASTGNTAASAAAYAATAGVPAIVLLPDGKVAAGKLAQAVIYGARIVTVRGNFDAALRVARDAAARYDVALVNSVNPYRIEGQTTGAYEICESLGDAPAVLALPVGNGGNITAYRLGFMRALERGRSARAPRMIGAQAAGAAPLVHGHVVEAPETVATAIRIGNPATWDPAIAAARDSGGAVLAVTDDEILEAWRCIASLTGVFCEPASAAGVAALRKQAKTGIVRADEQCVCVLTGNGLKDAERALSLVQQDTVIDATPDALAAALGWTTG